MYILVLCHLSMKWRYWFPSTEEETRDSKGKVAIHDLIVRMHLPLVLALAHPAPPTLASWLPPKQAQHALASVPLSLLFLPPGMLLPHLLAWPSP